jgi:hypothetical protein
MRELAVGPMQIRGKNLGRLSILVSHPFHDEAVEWMGHPAMFRRARVVRIVQAV